MVTSVAGRESGRESRGLGPERKIQMSGGVSHTASSECSDWLSRGSAGTEEHFGDSMNWVAARDTGSGGLRHSVEGGIYGATERFGAMCSEDVGIRLRETRARQGVRRSPPGGDGRLVRQADSLGSRSTAVSGNLFPNGSEGNGAWLAGILWMNSWSRCSGRFFGAGGWGATEQKAAPRSCWKCAERAATSRGQRLW
jgi:hypothetical protein